MIQPFDDLCSETPQVHVYGVRTRGGLEYLGNYDADGREDYRLRRMAADILARPVEQTRYIGLVTQDEQGAEIAWESLRGD